MQQPLDPRAEPQPGYGTRAVWSRLDRPVLLAVAIYLASSAAILLAGIHLSENHFIYPLDDVYIHMDVAKNLALHGVWGVTPYEFSSSSSSPVWVLLLAAVYRLVGVNRYAPLLLSWLCGLASLFVVSGMLGRTTSARIRTTTLVTFVLFTPLFALGTLGMEHALHLLLTLLFVTSFQATHAWKLALLTILLCGTRYEGVLMAAIATLVLLIERRWLRALIVAVSAWIPIGLYAWFSVAHGGYWLPNSVAIKGVRMHGEDMPDRAMEFVTTFQDNVTRAPHLALLLAAIVVLAAILYRHNRALAAPVALVAGAGVLHLFFADVNWAFRYESYLVGVGIVVLAATWPFAWVHHRRVSLAVACLLIPAVAVLGLRSYLAATLLPHYSASIYLQQFQMARFFNAYYPGQPIAVNDIDLIDYATDLHLFDLGGLASAAVFQAKRSGDYDTDFLEHEAAARGVRVAVLYDSWFSDHPVSIPLGGPPVPDSWILVSRWTVPLKYQLGDRTVSFYAIDQSLATQLRNRLNAFEPSLPESVTATAP